VKIGHGEADFLVGLKAAGRRVHLDTWWLEGVFGRENEHPMVLAAYVGGIWWTVDDKIPDQDVFLVGGSPDERGWLLPHGNILL